MKHTQAFHPVLRQAQMMSQFQVARFSDKQTDKETEKPKEDLVKEDAKKEEQEYEEEEETNKFKTHRRFMFALGKTLKYTMWASFAYYCYHLYLVWNKKKPEEGTGAHPMFLDWAQFTKFAVEDLQILLTRPPVNSLLMERPPLPPGH